MSLFTPTRLAVTEGLNFRVNSWFSNAGPLLTRYITIATNAAHLISSGAGYVGDNRSTHIKAPCSPSNS